MFDINRKEIEAIGVNYDKLMQAFCHYTMLDKTDIYYHNVHHIVYMLTSLENGRYLGVISNIVMTPRLKSAIQVAIIYHDLVYVVGGANNESNSANRFLADNDAIDESNENALLKQEIYHAILNTKTHDPSPFNDVANILCVLDLIDMIDPNHERILQNLINLYLESKNYPTFKDYVLDAILFAVKYKNKIEPGFERFMIILVEILKMIDERETDIARIDTYSVNLLKKLK